MSQNLFPAIVEDISQAGLQLTALEAAEGSAGNISVFTRHLEDLDAAFVPRGTLPLPQPMPALAGAWVVITATGRRLRDARRAPGQTLVVLQILPDGAAATLNAAENLRPTSEWNSHLAVHADHAARRGATYQALVHAQPQSLTYLSHHPAYPTEEALTEGLMRWEPETIMTFPEGFGLIPFHVPGSAIQMEETVARLRPYRLVVWQKHGVVARSDGGARHAADLVEYAEMAARYETLNLRCGQAAPGLSHDDLRAICSEIGLPLSAFLARQT
jgi:rhamnulose-1-phosphate aldolase